MTYDDGTKFIGEWKDNNEWKGIEQDEQGNVIATYLDGTLQIESSSITPNSAESAPIEYLGGTYTGEMFDGIPDGRGTLSVSGGSRYVGQWQGGKTHGQGVMIFADGSKYVGNWKDGMRNGRGTMFYTGGRKFIGEFKLFPWEGTEYDKEGTKITTYSTGVRSSK